ncbi:hypothetical protein RGQ21_68080 [Kitasatospora aureofaciens]|nr:hypothetical protein RGQ21_68080 [Kitasatospora aureofaciens]
MIESLYGTPITVERSGEDVYLDIDSMEDVLLSPRTAIWLASKLTMLACEILGEDE